MARVFPSADASVSQFWNSPSRFSASGLTSRKYSSASARSSSFMPPRRRKPNTIPSTGRDLLVLGARLERQLVVLDAEVVANLVEHRQLHLVPQLLLAMTRLEQGETIEGDFVGQHHRIAGAALPDRGALIEAECPAGLTQLVGRSVLDGDGDVAQQALEAWGKLVAGLEDEASEPPARTSHAAAPPGSP